MRDAGDGAGDDQADAGTKTFEREQEISLANNSREMLDQSEHALERIDNGTYGICESCGNPIGKLRLQAFPRATLCMSCKTEAGAPLIPPRRTRHRRRPPVPVTRPAVRPCSSRCHRARRAAVTVYAADQLTKAWAVAAPAARSSRGT